MSIDLIKIDLLIHLGTQIKIMIHLRILIPWKKSHCISFNPLNNIFKVTFKWLSIQSPFQKIDNVLEIPLSMIHYWVSSYIQNQVRENRNALTMTVIHMLIAIKFGKRDSWSPFLKLKSHLGKKLLYSYAMFTFW